MNNTDDLPLCQCGCSPVWHELDDLGNPTGKCLQCKKCKRYRRGKYAPRRGDTRPLGRDRAEGGGEQRDEEIDW